jgi:hypothetical protein
MNLENVTVEMRPRNEWEATDFGARMIRRDARAIYAVWFAVTLPFVALALLLNFLTSYGAFALLLYWWFEPVADGAILRIISRRLFGEDADIKATLREVPKLAWMNRIYLFTPYRLHFARSVAMPVTQLEGLNGAARKARSKVLNLKIFNYGVGITAAYEHLVMALYFGIMLIGYSFVPDIYRDTLGDSWLEFFYIDSSRGATAIGLLVFYIAQSALQPWYVGAGFGLYINCRTQLEAWDIEVAFRRLVQRRAGSVAAAVLLVLFVAPQLLWHTASLAQEPEPQSAAEERDPDPGFVGFWSDDEVQPALKNVISSDALSTTQKVEEWQRIQSNEPEEEEEESDSGLSRSMLDTFFGAISAILEFGLWILVALLALIAFLARDRWLPYLGLPGLAPPRERRIFLAGGELTADQLPDDIVGAVRDAWRNKHKREALSLLYRGSVFAAVREHGVRLPLSATEGACVRAVSAQTDSTRSQFFGRVVDLWIRCAYDHQDPDDDAVLPLCDEWHRHFGATL